MRKYIKEYLKKFFVQSLCFPEILQALFDTFEQEYPSTSKQISEGFEAEEEVNALIMDYAEESHMSMVKLLRKLTNFIYEKLEIQMEAERGGLPDREEDEEERRLKAEQKNKLIEKIEQGFRRVTRFYNKLEEDLEDDKDRGIAKVKTILRDHLAAILDVDVDLDSFRNHEKLAYSKGSEDAPTAGKKKEPRPPRKTRDSKTKAPSNPGDQPLGSDILEDGLVSDSQDEKRRKVNKVLMRDESGKLLDTESKIIPIDYWSITDDQPGDKASPDEPGRHYLNRTRPKKGLKKGGGAQSRGRLSRNSRKYILDSRDSERKLSRNNSKTKLKSKQKRKKRLNSASKKRKRPMSSTKREGLPELLPHPIDRQRYAEDEDYENPTLYEPYNDNMYPGEKEEFKTRLKRHSRKQRKSKGSRKPRRSTSKKNLKKSPSNFEIVKKTYNDGIYKGEFSNGMKNGTGKFTWNNGDSYEGEWLDDKIHGKGILISIKDQSVYKGDFRDGKRHGKGFLRYVNGQWYDGEWRDGKKSGYGKETFQNGDKYDGYWEDGKLDGSGKYSWVEGDYFDGFFSKGQGSGEGLMIYANGEQERGVWKDGNFYPEE